MAGREGLDGPITAKEVQVAVASLQMNKTPSPDGLPVEFYKTNVELIVPHFHKLLQFIKGEGGVPQLMSEAVIVVAPKPSKDPELEASYRPISLSNVDAKIFTKILANSVILSLVHGNQSGFMPGRGTDINLRRLYTNLSHVSTDRSPGVVASLDAEKAFVSMEWRSLWKVLVKFEFGPRFISWIQQIYKALTARVRTNGNLSPPFSLQRGTKQGCPLSPGFFGHHGRNIFRNQGYSSWPINR